MEEMKLSALLLIKLESAASMSGSNQVLRAWVQHYMLGRRSIYPETLPHSPQGRNKLPDIYCTPLCLVPDYVCSAHECQSWAEHS